MKETVPGREIKQRALERHLETARDYNSSRRNWNLANDAADLLLRDDPTLNYSAEHKKIKKNYQTPD